MKKFKKKFAYGGTKMDIDTPQEDLSQIRRLVDDALALSANDPTVTGLNLLGKTMINTGMSMAGKGFNQAGDLSGASGFLQDNFGSLSSLSNGASATFATGGTTNKFVEVEGKEVAEFPNGEVGEFSGPSHEKGGIKTMLPSGTDIYSKRLKVNGVKMSDRKLTRERLENKFNKLLDKNPNDKIIQRTLDRVKQNNSLLDQKDMMIQNTLHSMHRGIKRALGGTIDDLDPDQLEELQTYADENSMTVEDAYDELYNSQEEEQDVQEEINTDEVYLEDAEDNIYEEEEEEFATGGNIPGPKYKLNPLFENMQLPLGNLDNTFNSPLSEWSDEPIYISQEEASKIYNNPNLNVNGGNNTSPIGTTTDQTSTNSYNPLGNFSLGDLVGMGSSLYGAFQGRRNTLNNRAGDTPNINPYTNYGNDGLKTISAAKDNLAFTRDQNLQDLERSRNAGLSRIRNSARGINTLRAMNLATDASVNNSKNKVYGDYSNRLNSILFQEANLQNQRDRMVMQGEASRDMNDRRDRDNFYSQLGIDNDSITTGLQNFAKQLNTNTERQMNKSLLNSLSQYFDVDITADGSIEFTNKKKNKK